MTMMRPERKTKIALGLGVVSGLTVLVCTFLLITDHVVAARSAPAEKDRVEQLAEQAKTDPAAAEVLHKEREIQTQASLVRKARGRFASWILLVAGGVFVAGGKWYMSSRPQPQPSLDELIAVRFAPPAASTGKRRQAAAVAESEVDAAIDLGFVDELVEKLGRGREAAIPILQAIQNHYRYLPDEALARVCERTEITPAQIAGTSSFYSQFRRSPVGRHVVRVCHGTACHVAGAEHITQELRRHLEIPPGEDTDPRRRFTLDAVACLGCCSLAPVMMIEEETAGHLTPASARQALDAVEPES
jgi:NADH:ubiquinone oxidoreductase subunit E